MDVLHPLCIMLHSKFARGFPGSECHLRGTPSTFCLPRGARVAFCQPGPAAQPCPSLVPSCSLQTELGAAVCECGSESSGVTLLGEGLAGFCLLSTSPSVTICFHLPHFS